MIKCRCRRLVWARSAGLVMDAVQLSLPEKMAVAGFALKTIKQWRPSKMIENPVDMSTDETVIRGSR